MASRMNSQSMPIGAPTLPSKHDGPLGILLWQPTPVGSNVASLGPTILNLCLFSSKVASLGPTVLFTNFWSSRSLCWSHSKTYTLRWESKQTMHGTLSALFTPLHGLVSDWTQIQIHIYIQLQHINLFCTVVWYISMIFQKDNYSGRRSHNYVACSVTETINQEYSHDTIIVLRFPFNFIFIVQVEAFCSNRENARVQNMTSTLRSVETMQDAHMIRGIPLFMQSFHK
jgi:hypothetical protein